MSNVETTWTGWTSPWQPHSSRITQDACCSDVTFPLNLRSYQQLRGLCLFVLFSLCWEWWNSETFLLNLHKLWCGDCCCHTFLRKLCTPTNSHTYTQSISLSLTAGLCHDEGSVTPSLLPEKRSVRVHSYITQTLTAAALSSKKEKGTDI